MFGVREEERERVRFGELGFCKVLSGGTSDGNWACKIGSTVLSIERVLLGRNIETLPALSMVPVRSAALFRKSGALMNQAAKSKLKIIQLKLFAALLLANAN